MPDRNRNTSFPKLPSVKKDPSQEGITTPDPGAWQTIIIIAETPIN